MTEEAEITLNIVTHDLERVVERMKNPKSKRRFESTIDNMINDIIIRLLEVRPEAEKIDGDQ